VTERDTTRLIAWSTELRAVHRRIRDALRVTREAEREPGSTEQAGRDLLIYCHRFCAALDGHHRGEDRALPRDREGASEPRARGEIFTDVDPPQFLLRWWTTKPTIMTPQET
jgi:hypothetical protein